MVPSPLKTHSSIRKERGEEHISELLHHIHGIYRIKIVCVGVEETGEGGESSDYRRTCLEY